MPRFPPPLLASPSTELDSLKPNRAAPATPPGARPAPDLQGVSRTRTQARLRESSFQIPEFPATAADRPRQNSRTHDRNWSRQALRSRLKRGYLKMYMWRSDRNRAPFTRRSHQTTSRSTTNRQGQPTRAHRITAKVVVRGGIYPPDVVPSIAKRGWIAQRRFELCRSTPPRPGVALMKIRLLGKASTLFRSSA